MEASRCQELHRLHARMHTNCKRVCLQKGSSSSATVSYYLKEGAYTKYNSHEKAKVLDWPQSYNQDCQLISVMRPQVSTFRSFSERSNTSLETFRFELLIF